MKTPIVINLEKLSITYLKDMSVSASVSSAQNKGTALVVNSRDDLSEMATSKLLALFNKFSDAPTKRFATRTSGISRVWRMLDESRPVIRETVKEKKTAAKREVKRDYLIERGDEIPFKETTEPYAIMTLVGPKEKVTYETLMDRGLKDFKPKRSEKFQENPRKFVRDYISFCIKVGALRRIECE